MLLAAGTSLTTRPATFSVAWVLMRNRCGGRVGCQMQDQRNGKVLGTGWYSALAHPFVIYVLDVIESARY
ncbi:hypothetical protein BC628DRAFT_1394254 [Trametes gibbosa]|nr:hypothetical protein BC628DRAFT_1394254 [Trametes gibbosa]